MSRGSELGGFRVGLAGDIGAQDPPHVAENAVRAPAEERVALQDAVQVKGDECHGADHLSPAYD
jgi:hypothetical protein